MGNWEAERLGVFVLGMHRSGTSLVTGVVNRLGPAVGPQHQLFSGDQFNHDGYFELKSIVRLHDRVLRSLGGWASAPPEVGSFRPSTGQTASLDGLVSGLFSGPHVVKDPRQCLLLPLWQEVYGDNDYLPVVVLRHPEQVIDSLVRRNGYARELALALWEHYNRELFRNLAGRPAFVIQYSQLVDDTPAIVEQLASALHSYSNGVIFPNAQEIATAVTLIRRRPAESESSTRSLQSDNWERVRGLAGSYRALPNVPITVSEVSVRALEQRRRRLQVLRALPDLGATLRGQLDRRRHAAPSSAPRVSLR